MSAKPISRICRAKVVNYFDMSKKWYKKYRHFQSKET